MAVLRLKMTRHAGPRRRREFLAELITHKMQKGKYLTPIARPITSGSETPWTLTMLTGNTGAFKTYATSTSTTFWLDPRDSSTREYFFAAEVETILGKMPLDAWIIQPYLFGGDST